MRVMLNDKAPVDFFIPEEGGPASLKNIAILRDARHPNSARLFVDHFLSKGNIEFLRDNSFDIGTRDDYEAKANKITLKTYASVWPLNQEKFMREIRGFLHEFVNEFGL